MKKLTLTMLGTVLLFSTAVQAQEQTIKGYVSIKAVMTKTDGIYGGRFSGAGFKGCCMALINPDKEEEVLTKVSEAYLKEYPSLKRKYQAAICHSADGVGIDL